MVGQTKCIGIEVIPRHFDSGTLPPGLLPRKCNAGVHQFGRTLPAIHFDIGCQLAALFLCSAIMLLSSLLIKKPE
jgi:hypothetical protein